jgi:hypothetical protein
MAFFNLTRDLFENVTISLTPNVTYVSGSLTGITGSSFIMPVRSPRLKEIRTSNTDESINNSFNETVALTTINSINSFAKDYRENTNAVPIDQYMHSYMTASNDLSLDVKYDKKINIARIEPPPTFASGTLIKRHIQNFLMPHYKHQYDDCGYYYRNYNTLNFFTSSNIPENSALIYPNENGQYSLSTTDFAKSPLTVQFWINPRYKNDKEHWDFHAGTIFHISSSIAISLISGSQKDKNGLVNSYKILAQLSQSADISPSLIDFSSANNRTYPNDLWATSSFELKHNHWHHVTVRWGSKFFGNLGSIVVDSNETEFTINSASLFTKVGDPHVVVGNYYQGTPNALASFFNDKVKLTEGVSSFGASEDAPPSSVQFKHPLNAEIHELKFYNSYLTDTDLKLSGSGVTENDMVGQVGAKNLRFYLPPYFIPSSSKQEYLYDGTFKVTTSSYTPTNSLFGFSKNGKEINLQSFTTEFVKRSNPRLFNLTSSAHIVNATSPIYENVENFMFDKDSQAKRNLTILPNDNGQFRPNYYILSKSLELARTSKATDAKTGVVTQGFDPIDHLRGGSLGEGKNYDLIKIENQLLSNTFNNNSLFDNSLLDEMLGGILTQENNGALKSAAQEKIQNAYNNDNIGAKYPLALAEDIKDDSSNYISIFNISNLYYGNRIHPGSFKIIEESLTGSMGKIKVKLSDNKRGGVFRSDCLTKQADWNIVGNLFYDEGLLIIKTPHLPFYGKDKFEMNFKGEQNIHSMVLNVPAPRSALNKSHNNTFVSLPKSENANDENTSAICITGVNIHDKNFNIIMKANLAQPIIKDNTDEFVIRLKMDF